MRKCLGLRLGSVCGVHSDIEDSLEGDGALFLLSLGKKSSGVSSASLYSADICRGGCVVCGTSYTC